MDRPTPTTSMDGRRHRRERKRLRPIKLVDAAHRFLDDGAVVDGSRTGIRIRHFSDIRLPARLVVYDEYERTMRPAVVAWSRQREAGLRFTAPALPASRTDRLRLGSRYYALKD